MLNPSLLRARKADVDLVAPDSNRTVPMNGRCLARFRPSLTTGASHEPPQRLLARIRSRLLFDALGPGVGTVATGVLFGWWAVTIWIVHDVK